MRLIPLLLACLMVGTAGAQYTHKTIADFSGGLVTRYDATHIPDNACQTGSQNVTFETGIIKSYPGFTATWTLPSAAGVAVSALFEVRWRTGLIDYVVQCGSVIYKSSDDGDSWEALSAGWSTFYPIDAVVHKDVLYIMNSINTTIGYNRVTVSTYTDIPKGRWGKSFNGRLWIAGNSASPNSVYFSRTDVAPSSTDAFPPQNEIVVNADDGDVINGITSQSDKMILYKKYATYGIIDTNQVITMSRAIGCRDSGSIQNTDGPLLFLANDGLYSLMGGYRFLSEKVFDDIKGLNVYGGGLFTWRLRETTDLDSGTNDGTQTSSNTVGPLATSYRWDTDAKFNAGTYISSVTVSNGSVVLSTNAAVTTTTQTITQVTAINPLSLLVVGASDINNMVDNKTETATSIPLTPIFKQIVVGGNSFYGLKSGNDFVQIRLGLGEYKNVRSVSWVYDFTDGENYLNNTYVQIKYRDPLSGDYRFYDNNTFSPAFERLDIGDNLDGYRYHNPPEGYHWINLDSSGDGSGAGDGHWYVNYWSGKYTSEAYTDQIQINIYARPEAYRFNQHMYIREIYVEVDTADQTRYSTGTYISDSFDTGMTNPRYGRFKVGMSSTTNSDTVFYGRTSADNTSWTAWTQLDVSSECSGLTQSRYFQWRADFKSVDGNGYSVIRDVEINAVNSTGTYTSPTFNTGSVSYWHLFESLDTASSGTITHYYRSSTTSAGLASANWTAIASGETIGSATQYMWIQLKTDFTTTNGSYPPYVNGYSIGWFKGDKGVPTCSAWYERNYLLGCADGAAYNNVIYGLDKNGSWYKLTGVYPGAMIVTDDGRLLVGSSTGSVVHLFNTGSNYGGESSSSTWISRTFEYFNSIDEIDRAKNLRMLSLVAKTSDPSVPLYVGFSDGYSVEYSTFTISLPNNEYKSVTVNIPKRSPQKSWQFKIYTDQPDVQWEVRSLKAWYDLLDAKPQ